MSYYGPPPPYPYSYYGPFSIAPPVAPPVNEDPLDRIRRMKQFLKEEEEELKKKDEDKKKNEKKPEPKKRTLTNLEVFALSLVLSPITAPAMYALYKWSWLNMAAALTGVK